ncbi:hypothetical protein ACLOJK_037440 [Asimina triloba]
MFNKASTTEVGTNGRELESLRAGANRVVVRLPDGGKVAASSGVLIFANNSLSMIHRELQAKVATSTTKKSASMALECKSWLSKTLTVMKPSTGVMCPGNPMRGSW